MRSSCTGSDNCCKIRKEITSILGLQGNLHDSEDIHIERGGMEIAYEKTQFEVD